MSGRLDQLENLAQLLGEEVGDVAQKLEAGFALLLFDHGEGGWLTYVSNSDRADMTIALLELIEKLYDDPATPMETKIHIASWRDGATTEEINRERRGG